MLYTFQQPDTCPSTAPWKCNVLIEKTDCTSLWWCDINDDMSQSLPLRAVVSKGVGSCHGKLSCCAFFCMVSHLYCWILMWYGVIASSIGITLSWRPSKGVAQVWVSFTRMNEGIYHSCTTGELSICSSSGWRMIWAISPWAPLVMLRSVSTLSVTIILIPIASLILCARSFKHLLCVHTISSWWNSSM